jgi:hypothetical protein
LRGEKEGKILDAGRKVEADSLLFLLMAKTLAKCLERQ